MDSVIAKLDGRSLTQEQRTCFYSSAKNEVVVTKSTRPEAPYAFFLSIV